MKKAVDKLQNGKSAGDDRTVAELLKNGGKAVIDWLWELLQTVWRTRQVISEWKSSTLLPLHKKNDRKVCNNYRGISLFNVPGKVLTLMERTQHSRSNLGDSSGSGKSERVLNPSVSLFC